MPGIPEQHLPNVRDLQRIYERTLSLPPELRGKVLTWLAFIWLSDGDEAFLRADDAVMAGKPATKTCHLRQYSQAMLPYLKDHQLSLRSEMIESIGKSVPILLKCEINGQPLFPAPPASFRTLRHLTLTTYCALKETTFTRWTPKSLIDDIFILECACAFFTRLHSLMLIIHLPAVRSLHAVDATEELYFIRQRYSNCTYGTDLNEDIRKVIDYLATKDIREMWLGVQVSGTMEGYCRVSLGNKGTLLWEVYVGHGWEKEISPYLELCDHPKKGA